MGKVTRAFKHIEPRLGEMSYFKTILDGKTGSHQNIKILN
jgi:hypothetical protein